MIEVEAKASIDNPGVLRRLARRYGRYIGKEKKIDDYYTTQPEGKYPMKSVRIRKREGWYEVNFKQKISYARGVHAKKETEFRIGDLKDFIALLKDMGFRLWLRKKKESEVYEIKKNFHIEINKVQGLGWFVEVEYLCNLPEVSKARAAVVGMIEKLGISKSKVIEEGYTKLLWDKHQKS